MSTPRTRRLPRVIGRSPVMQRTKVDFPEPERPMMQKFSPLQTDSETCRTAAATSHETRSCSGCRLSKNCLSRIAPRPKTFQTSIQSRAISNVVKGSHLIALQHQAPQSPDQAGSTMPLPLHLSKVDILKLSDHFPERPVADLSHLDLGRQLGIRKPP